MDLESQGSRRPRILVERLRVGSHWLVRVTCLQGRIDRCRVFYNGTQLIPAGSRSTYQLHEQAISNGQPMNFSLPQEVPVPDDQAEVVVRDEDRLLMKAEWRGLIASRE